MISWSLSDSAARTPALLMSRAFSVCRRFGLSWDVFNLSRRTLFSPVRTCNVPSHQRHQRVAEQRRAMSKCDADAVLALNR